MKFKVETTIPQRQYENLKTSYECDITEKDTAISHALNDLRVYNNIIGKETPIQIYKPKEGEEIALLKDGKTTDTLIFEKGKWRIK